MRQPPRDGDWHPPGWDWSPRKTQWASIHKKLPADAEMQKFDAAVTGAVWSYRGLRLDCESWKRIAKLGRSSTITKLRREIEQLESWPPSTAEALVRECLGCLDLLFDTAEFAADFQKSLWQSREEQLYSMLLQACTGPGKLPLNDSESGPLNQVMRKILRLVLTKPPNNRGIRDIIQREKSRRPRGEQVLSGIGRPKHKNFDA